jgi:hypothetical protein
VITPITWYREDGQGWQSSPLNYSRTQE